jgi:pimeloyl-ACP methyl ester carboxylesterase
MSRVSASRRGGSALAVLLALAATLGVALAQQAPVPNPNPQPGPDAAKGAPRGRFVGKGGLRTGVAVPPKAAPGKADAFGANAPAPANANAPGIGRPAGARPGWPFHYRFRITGADGVALAATFFPSRAADRAPVVLLVHQTGTGHSSRDFERPVEGLKNETLAAHLQSLDYAVLLVDLRGHGGTARRELAAGAGENDARRWTVLGGDLQTAYSFLIDRHNRRELNLGMFGVVGVGDAGSLVTVWAASPNAAVANPGRISDLGALALVCPPLEVPGLRVAPSLASLAPRLPMLLLTSNRDAELTKAAGPLLARNARSRIEPFDTALGGDQLLRFEPKSVEALTKFLDDTVKFRKNVDWEPRYLLQPVAASEVKLIPGNTPPDAAKDAAKDAPKDKADAEARAKAEEEAKAKGAAPKAGPAPEAPKAKGQPAPKAAP